MRAEPQQDLGSAPTPVGSTPLSKAEKAERWLQALRVATLDWGLTDYRKRMEYARALDAVLTLVEIDYIDNALDALTRSEGP